MSLVDTENTDIGRWKVKMSRMMMIVTITMMIMNTDSLYYLLDIIGFFVILPVFVQLMNFAGNITLLL